MKKKIRILSLCFVLLAAVTVFAVTPFAFAEDKGNSKVTVTDSSGTPVTDVALPQGEKVTLTANAELTGDVQYQWQILADANSDLWVNISGENAKTIEASYAMVCSVLKDNQTALRCVAVGEETAAGDAVKITVKKPKATPAKVSAVRADKAATVADKREAGSEDKDTYSIVINYQFKNGTQAAGPWTATIEKGGSIQQTIESPAVIGYTPDQASVEINEANIQSDKTYTVTYNPAEVSYTVKHFQQNIANDEYTLVDTETKKGMTEAAVGEGHKKTYEGFTALLYDTTTQIAADGSTVVEIYYDRNYYLLSLDLDGGYGSEPIYARFGSAAATIVKDPQRAGYIFAGWQPVDANITYLTIPETMPAENIAFKAKWNPRTDITYSVVFWYENADDNGYSYVASKKMPGRDGDTVQSSSFKDTSFDGRDSDHFTYNAAKAETVTVNADGSTVLNVYFTRNTYTLTFRKLDCDKWFFHDHSDSCYKTVKTITAKYGAKVSDEFGKAPFNTTYNGRAWECTDSSKFGYALQTLDRMPGFDAAFNLYDKNSETKKTIYYYVQKVGTTVNANRWPANANSFDLLKQVDTYFNYATYDEEYHEILGFTRYSAEVAGFANNEKNFSNNRLNLYYMRNSYDLKFYNHNGYVNGKGGSVQYEAPLSSYDFTPDPPEGFEKNAYVFDGWYTSAGCYAGSEADLDNMTMPASNFILYAKWAPKTHTVKTFLTEDVITDDRPLNTWENVEHRATVDKPENPTNGNYNFVGWFYKENGVEKAFDFSMPIIKDLNLYAKWSSDNLVKYTIHYELDDGTSIGDDTVGSALAGTTKTFDAKIGNALNKGYQTGYYPVTSSHSVLMEIDGKNEFTFKYVAKEKVAYTVRYLEKGTERELVPEKSPKTSDAVVTEKFKVIQGYAPDAYQKRLVLSATESENVITFWYEKSDLVPVQIIHWLQNISGDGYTEYESSTKFGKIGDTVSKSPKQYDYFQYNDSKSNHFGTITPDGLVLNFYYDRNVYPYLFKHVERENENNVFETVPGEGRYQATVTKYSINVPGYTLVSAETEHITIVADENEPVKNVKTFYYTESSAEIKYVAKTFGGSDGGYVSPDTENVKVFTGTANGSKATAKANYKFVGWYSDEGCTNQISTDPNFVPQKDHNYSQGSDEPKLGYIGATYYAKFEPDIVDLTIVKSGAVDVDENQSFIFHISGDVSENEDLPMAKAVDMDVIVYGNGNTTVKSLPAGTYRVTEMNGQNNGWSWRYTAGDGNQQTITPIPGSDKNKLTFANTRNNTKWLNGGNFAKNLFNPNIEHNGYKTFGECVGVWNHSCTNKKSMN